MSCYRLTSLNFVGVSSVPTLYPYCFTSTPIAGYTDYTDGQLGSVYVPASLYDAFVSASYWSDIASRIVSVA